MSPLMKRSYYVSLVTALSLAIAYGFGFDLPYFAPLFAFLLTLAANKPYGFKALASLVLLIAITLGTGFLLIPLLEHYPAVGLIIVFIGIYISTHITINLGKMLVGTFFMVGMTLISIVGTMSFALALTVVDSILSGVICGVICQWVVYPFFFMPDESNVVEADAVETNLVECSAADQNNPGSTEQEEQKNKISGDAGKWIAIKTTAIVFPVYLLALTNPALYIPTVMKTVSLGQQSSEVDVQKAGYELLLSTLMAGVFAIAFWSLLQWRPTLWIFFLLTLMFSLIINRRLFGLVKTRFAPSFWQNTLVTLLILVGPAVQDSMNGDDVYKAFLVRMGLFVLVSLYAWFALKMLEHLRRYRLQRRTLALS